MKDLCIKCGLISENTTKIHCPNCGVPNVHVVYDEVADYIDRLQQASRWIPESERLPEVNWKVVMVAKGKRIIGLAAYHKDDHWETGEQYTYWRELPTPPEGE